MVLENLYSVEFVRKNPQYAVVLGIAYSVIGIAGAIIIFPESPSLVAVAFTSILLMPILGKLIRYEEREEAREKHFSFAKLYRDNCNSVLIFVAILFGSELVFLIFSALFAPEVALRVFHQQLTLTGYSGLAVNGPALSEILQNNLLVLFLSFVFGILAGHGAIFFLIWNVSVWGAIFGALIRKAAFAYGGNPASYYATILLTTLPHGTLEMLGYILAAISGGVISYTIASEKFESARVKEVILDNVVLLAIAIVLVAAGALIETLVLANSPGYAALFS